MDSLERNFYIVERFRNVDPEILRWSRIISALSAMIDKKEEIPKDDDFRFVERAQAMVEKFQRMLGEEDDSGEKTARLAWEALRQDLEGEKAAKKIKDTVVSTPANETPGPVTKNTPLDYLGDIVAERASDDTSSSEEEQCEHEPDVAADWVLLDNGYLPRAGYAGRVRRGRHTRAESFWQRWSNLVK